ncbi:hypothetical protein SRHO_G00213890 [Serrasalmus rhombeus]
MTLLPRPLSFYSSYTGVGLGRNPLVDRYSSESHAHSLINLAVHLMPALSEESVQRNAGIMLKRHPDNFRPNHLMQNSSVGLWLGWDFISQRSSKFPHSNSVNSVSTQPRVPDATALPSN